MRHIQTVAGANIRKGAHTGCGECQSRETKIFRPEKNRD